MYKSHARMERQATPILSILERRLRTGVSRALEAGDEYRSLLDRMVLVTRATYPAISDLAREVRYRCFDQPLFEQTAARSTPRLESTCPPWPLIHRTRAALSICGRSLSAHSRWHSS